MADESTTRRVTILLDESLIEELRGWLTINCGEIVKVEKPRNKNKPVPEHHEATEVHDQVTLEPPRSFDDLQREVVSAESHHEEELDDRRCIFCRNSPCILRSENLPDKLRASGPPRMTKQCKRKADYRALYTILKRKWLWCDPIYVQRKEALGCYIDDVREVMPVCVVEDVRKRWPNPDGVPYCGHRRT